MAAISPAFAELMEVCKRRDRIWFALVAKCGNSDKVSISDCEELARKEIAKEAKVAEKAAAKEAKAAAKEASRKMRETPVLMEGRIERRVTPALKRKVAFEQAYCCAKCSKGPLEHFDIDHIIPLSRGGTNAKENLWMLCLDCHREKTVIERAA
jgi:5-methylcytosine-specific restriction endonuclease McrA